MQRKAKFLGQFGSEQAMSLVEVVIAMTICAVIIFSTLSILHSTQPMVNSTMSELGLQEKARNAMEKMVSEIRMAYQGEVEVGGIKHPSLPKYNSLTFSRVVSLHPNRGEPPILEEPITYRLAADPTDPANGFDDNQNGLVDEKILVREQGDSSIVVLHNIVYNGQGDGELWFEKVPPGLIKIEMTVATTDPEKTWNQGTQKYENKLMFVTLKTNALVRTFDGGED